MSTTADRQPLGAVTRKKQWQLATSELRHGHQFAAQGYFAPLVQLQVIIVLGPWVLAIGSWPLALRPRSQQKHQTLI